MWFVSFRFFNQNNRRSELIVRIMGVILHFVRRCPRRQVNGYLHVANGLSCMEQTVKTTKSIKTWKSRLLF